MVGLGDGPYFLFDQFPHVSKFGFHGETPVRPLVPIAVHLSLMCVVSFLSLGTPPLFSLLDISPFRRCFPDSASSGPEREHASFCPQDSPARLALSHTERKSNPPRAVSPST